MAYTAPITFVNGVPLTAAQLNAMQDNIRETAVAKATTAGRYFAVAGPNQLVERAVTRDTVDVIADTSSTSYTATLSGPSSGPVINSTCGERMIVGIHSYCRNLSGTGSAHASYAISGATTVAASDRVAVAVAGSADNSIYASAVMPVYFLTPGVHTLTAQYRVSAGSGRFDARRLWAMPL